MTDLHFNGEHIRLKDTFNWGNGRWAGAVVQITDVHDHRELTDDPDALIYGAQFLDPRDGKVMVTGIPVSPDDIDESYDHYEAQRAADFNSFLSFVTATKPDNDNRPAWQH
jgi:hypothetical protein